MSTRPDTGPVHPALRRAEAEVARHLEEACEELDRKDLGQESLDELLRLEDELLAAARAVDETVRLRRQLGERLPAAADSHRSAETVSRPQLQPETSAGRVRDFTDAASREWRVWEVRPGSSGRRINPERYLGEYVRGWLAFECQPDETRKRLPNHPSDWFRMADADLERLLPRAIDVPTRRSKVGSAATG